MVETEMFVPWFESSLVNYVTIIVITPMVGMDACKYPSGAVLTNIP